MEIIFPMTTSTTHTLLSADFLRRLERIAIQARTAQLGLTKGERKSKRKGVSTDFADYRDYVQGDDLRFVDWNIFGRLDALYLKIFQDYEDLTVHLLIDASKSMDFGTPKKIEFACQLAAAIGYIALCGLDRVTIEVFNGNAPQVFPPSRGKAFTGQMFSFLQNLSADGQTHLEQSCRSHFIRSRAKGVVILMTDFFDPAGYEGCLRQLSTSGSDLYAVHILAPEEMDPPLLGDLRLIDSETDAYTEISVSRALMKEYRKNREGFCESIRRHCMARGIGYLLAPSNTPFEQLVLGGLRRGGLLK